LDHFLAFKGFAFGLGEPFAEPFHASCGVNEPLLSREKGMTGRANIHLDQGNRRPCLKLVSARAPCCRDIVFGMYAFFHKSRMVAEFFASENS